LEFVAPGGGRGVDKMGNKKYFIAFLSFSEFVETRGQCYKTFFVSSVGMFVINESVCPWQGFPA
jgi:hypothetical protein